MKRNIVNDKVIRAMAIGISAMLATTTPMTALAAEEGEGAALEPSTGEEPKSESIVSEAKNAAEQASGSVDTAQESAETVKSDVEANVVGKTEEGPGEAGKDSDGNDLAQAVIDAAANVENLVAEGGAPLQNAKTDISSADKQLDVAQAKDELSDTEYSKAENAAAAAVAATPDVEAVKNAMDVANEEVDKQVQQIENATTVADANAAYDELAATADQAQKDFDAKLADYNKATKEYEDAVKAAADAEKAYNDAIANAGTNAAAAQAELARAEANAQDLEKAVEAAKAAVEIAAMEELTRNDGGLNWRNEDKLFIAIMENYYLPETQGIKDAVVTRVQGKDNNEYNYFKAVYKDADGNEQVKYFNYKMDDDGKSKDNIVIFEKRKVEIFGDANKTPDQYVKDDDQKIVVDVAAGLKNGTVVNADGRYFEKNDMTDSETLVSNSEITGTSKTDVTVDKDKQESWSYNEETGELVKTVTAEVTTITYRKDSFSGGSYEDEGGRNTAISELCENNYIKDADGNLIDANGKEVTITKTENTTYTATGTYIPTFTETVEVKNEEVEWKHTNNILDFGVKTEAEAVAQVKKDEEKDLKRKIEGDDNLYFLGVSSDLAVTGKTKGEWNDDSDFLVSGTVTATYAKVTKKTVDQSTFGSLWDDIKALITGGKSTNEKLKEEARKAIETDGGIFLSADWVDGKKDKATIRYVAGVKVTTDKQQTVQAAEDAVNAAIAAQAKANRTGVDKVNIADPVAHTTYSYTVDYLEQATKTTENKTIATETYGKASGLSGQIIQNKNYIDKNILLTQEDKGYRAFVGDASALVGDDQDQNLMDKYNRLLAEAQQANTDVADAQDKVDDLLGKIAKLKERDSNTEALATLVAKLTIAKADRDEAEETLNEILDKLEKAGVTRDEVVDRLTPNTPGGNGGNGGNPGGNDDIGGGTPGTTFGGPGADTTTDDTATVVTTTTTATATANTAVAAQTVAANGAGAGNVAAGNAGAGNAAGVAGNQGVVTIEDEASPLAASIDDKDTTNTKKIKEDAKTVTIEDESAPLDASIDQEKMSWWWLLIVLVLGATGYEMYRKHQEKKKAAEEIKVEE